MTHICEICDESAIVDLDFDLHADCDAHLLSTNAPETKLHIAFDNFRCLCLARLRVLNLEVKLTNLRFD